MRTCAHYKNVRTNCFRVAHLLRLFLAPLSLLARFPLPLLALPALLLIAPLALLPLFTLALLALRALFSRLLCFLRGTAHTRQ